MPLLYLKQLDPHTRLGLWELTEPAEELKTALPAYVALEAGLEQVHPRRQREWLASRALAYRLLHEFSAPPLQLLRNAHGKPYFPDSGLHISISHSPRLAAVILSDTYEVGIDIEIVSPKALRVQDKFLTEEEKKQTQGEEQKTCLYWSAKETLYKLYSSKRLILKENLAIQSSTNPNLLWGRVKTENFSKLYQVHVELLDDHVLTYSIDKTQPHPTT